MKYADTLRNQVEVLDEERDALAAELGTLDTDGADEVRSTEIAARAGEIAARAAAINTERAEIVASIESLTALEVERAAVPRGPEFIRKPDAPTPSDVRSMDRASVRDAALRQLEDRDSFAHLDNSDEVREHLEKQIRKGRTSGAHGTFDGGTIAQRFLLTENEHYRSAFTKGVTNSSPVFTTEEARAVDEFRTMLIGTDNVGGFGVPVLIDPTIILTAQGSLNPFRGIAKVVSITTDEWKGVSSAGVSWSIDSENATVSQDTPTLAQPTVTTGMGRGFVPFTIEVGGDYPEFASELNTLLMTGYDELQASHFSTGAVSSTNRGIITALDANTNVEVTPTTDGAFGAVDINKLWGALPDRYKSNATWVMNHDVGNEVSSFSSAGVGSFYTVNLSQGNAPQLKGRPVEFASYFPDFTGTTGASNLVVVGDFSNYVIVDRVGMNVELIPHLFDITNNRPTGTRGLFAWARFGGNSVNDLGFRLLQNQ
jgi:HK97 family phage major capsid protein